GGLRRQPALRARARPEAPGPSRGAGLRHAGGRPGHDHEAAEGCLMPETPADWVEICPYDSIYPDTGVCALVDGRQVAVFRLSDGSLHAVSNFDPFSQANVLSRGIVGDR